MAIISSVLLYSSESFVNDELPNFPVVIIETTKFLISGEPPWLVELWPPTAFIIILNWKYGAILSLEIIVFHGCLRDCENTSILVFVNTRIWRLGVRDARCDVTVADDSNYYMRCVLQLISGIVDEMMGRIIREINSNNWWDKYAWGTRPEFWLG